MKTSNKLIIGFIAAPFIIMSFVDAALYNKFKKGEYTLESNIDKQKLEKVLLRDEIHSVELSNLYSVDVVFGDENFIEWDKNDARDIDYKLVNGHLSIDLIVPQHDQVRNSYEHVVLHLKNAKDIRFANCSANLMADSTTQTDSLFLNLSREGSLSIGSFDRETESNDEIIKEVKHHNQFNYVLIKSQSQISFGNDLFIKNCKIEMGGNGSLNSNNTPFGNLELAMAEESRLNVTARFYERYLNKNAAKPVAVPAPVAPK